MRLLFVTTACVICNVATCADFIPPDLDAKIIGISAAPLEAYKSAIEEMGYRSPAKTGLIITSVAPGGPASRKGLKRFDVISRANGTAVSSTEQLNAKMNSRRPPSLTVHRMTEQGTKKIWKRSTAKVTPKTARELYTGLMVTKEDDVQEVSFCRHQSSAQRLNEETDVFLTFAMRNGSPTSLTLRTQFVASEWLFIRKITIKADDQTVNLPIGPTDGKRDNSGRKVWEWFDVPADGSLLKYLQAATTATEVTVRMSGDTSYSDFKLTEDHKLRLQAVMIAYIAVGGKLEAN